MKYTRLLFFIIPVFLLVACTKLEEKLNGEVSPDQVAGGGSSTASLLKGVYDAMRSPYQDQSRFWAAQEHTSDECIGPTRGGDWDDNGVWRILHVHKWDGDHLFLRQTFEDLGGVIYAGTDMLRFNPTAQQAAEARFLRAFAMFSMLDGWDQVPYREPGGDILQAPKVRKGTEALDYIIAEVNAIMNDLPATPVNKANKDAARVLLMKCYINKGVIANRATPAFAAADMDQVITLADQIINSNKYKLATQYFDNFAPNNDVISTENIFTAENIGGSSSGNVRSRWFCTLHYNNNPGGWNGFTTLSDFYNKFEAADVRRSQSYPGVTNVSGIKPGFLVGQQFDQNGVALKDRGGRPLAFTPEVKAIEIGTNLEVTGIRVIKYPIDYNNGDNSNNDYVYYRYADVILMKAEALLRKNNAAAALPLVNEVRTKRGIAALASVNLDQLLDERGREFYWEGMRRNDLIRFGKFLQPWQEKPTDDPKNLLFPIPNQQIAANPNLVQNTGY
ncbi:RagB/SusD family nutrient uptake outer membrane protein [Paraflavitalea soli]|uniref:RagB/SusD family nutrient uptake outer membrane protein n=1 Tax=Paraflavitalea soli TaxID=2315862 RepID=A0A3B7MYZ9_9BACT|nr:RagB/SusD family nutrient uptake outer membrane protein [Paraflavitalea soli]AXY76975.1 RagB/SusD family nutrient uptake outer membrane protein [Paraflavitalea soli]